MKHLAEYGEDVNRGQHPRSSRPQGIPRTRGDEPNGGGSDWSISRYFPHTRGWTNSHLHQFEIDGKRDGDLELLEDFRCIDSRITKTSEIVPKNGKKFSFLYEYDFGDDWNHEILFEGCLHAEKGVRYPLCLEGERACPPEDVGGIYGYEEYLEALADPKHERHKDFMGWRGPFDPEKFDAKATTKKMQRGLSNWKKME